MIIGLLLWNSFRLVFKIFRISKIFLSFFINGIFLRSLIRNNLICKQYFMYNSIKHSCSEYSGKKLFIWFRAPTWENSDKFSAPIKLLHCFMNDVSIFDHRQLLNSFIQLPKFIAVFIDHPINDLIDLWVNLVVSYRDIISTGWWDLDLPRESCLIFVAFTLGSSRPNLTCATFSPVFDLVKALLFAVEPFYLNHVKGISNQVSLDSHVQWTVTTQTWA